MSKLLRESKATKQKIINLILLGKTGCGKSSAGNTILSHSLFKTGDGKTSVTNISKLEINERDDLKVRVVDTPGLMDTSYNTEDILQRIFSAMSFCPEGFNALLYVMSYGDRFTQEDKEVLRLLKLCFGEKFTHDFCIIIINKGDCFDLAQEEKMLPDTFKDWLRKQKQNSSEFKDLLEECNERAVLFYNIGAAYQTKRENSRSELFEIINSMSGRYTSELFEKCSQQRNQFVEQLKCLHHTQFVEEELCLVKHYIAENMITLDKIKASKDKDVISKHNDHFNINIIKLQEKVQKLSAHIKSFGDDIGFLDDIYTILQTVQNISSCIIFSDISKIKTKLLEILEKVDKKKYDPSAAQIYDRFKVVKKVIRGTVLGGLAGSVVGAGAGATSSLMALGAVSLSVAAGPFIIVSTAGALTGGFIVYFLKDN